jgi:glycosyltransferase involved in cell wall biosynthesis
MKDGYPKISIVTPSYNQGAYLEQTIQSVLQSNYPNLEYLIIDGGSTDNSIDIIKRYENQLKYWISEPDYGQAHAINKGLMNCTGEIFNWLNSDDYLEPGALYAIGAQFAQPDFPDLVAGEVEIFNDKGSLEYVKHSKLTSKGLMIWEQGVTFVQPGVWMRRELIEKCGGIDEQFHYAFDWDLLIRYLYKAPKVQYLNQKIINFRYHEHSKTVRSIEKFAQEEHRILEKITSLSEFKGLKKIAQKKIAANLWMPQLKEIQSQPNKKLIKVYKILRQHKFQYLPIWQATLGAIKNIILE